MRVIGRSCALVLPFSPVFRGKPAFRLQVSQCATSFSDAALIDRHLAERRNLEREKSFQDAQQAFEREIREAAWPGQAQFYEPDTNQPLVLPREDLPFTRDQLKARPVLILAHISDKQAGFTRTDILRGLANHISDPLELRTASDQVMASSELVQISKGTRTQYTTREYLTAERSLETVASEMAQSGGFKVGPSNIGRAIKRENDRLQNRSRGQLSDEQVAAIDHILRPNQLSSVVGLAGVGKKHVAGRGARRVGAAGLYGSRRSFGG